MKKNIPMIKDQNTHSSPVKSSWLYRHDFISHCML